MIEDFIIQKAQAIRNPWAIAYTIMEKHIKPNIMNAEKFVGSEGFQSAHNFYRDLNERFNFGSPGIFDDAKTDDELVGKVKATSQMYDWKLMLYRIARGIYTKTRAKLWNPVEGHFPEFEEGGQGSINFGDYGSPEEMVDSLGQGRSEYGGYSEPGGLPQQEDESQEQEEVPIAEAQPPQAPLVQGREAPPVEEGVGQDIISSGGDEGGFTRQERELEALKLRAARDKVEISQEVKDMMEGVLRGDYDDDEDD